MGEVLDIPPLYKYFIAYWADIHNESRIRGYQELQAVPVTVGYKI